MFKKKDNSGYTVSESIAVNRKRNWKRRRKHKQQEESQNQDRTHEPAAQEGENSAEMMVPPALAKQQVTTCGSAEV
jgi:hypothetical protein